MRYRLLLLTIGSFGCGGGPGTADAGSPDAGRDDAGRADGGRTLEDAGSGDVDGGSDAGAVTCGTARPDVTSIRQTEGLVIARDGTIYFSQPGGVGRMAPDGSVDADWLRIDGVGTVLGLALDAANERLFVGVPSFGEPPAPSIFRVAIASAEATALVTGGAPNGLAMGPDGMLYYSDFAANHVLRVDPAGGEPMRVTASMISSPNGLAFESEGTLLVASYSSGQVVRLTLSAGGLETDREVAGAPGGSVDGLALDATGRIYVTDQFGGRLVRMDADGTDVTPLVNGLNAPANIEFGAGALDCADLYVTGFGSLVVHESDTAGGALPWH